MPGRAHVIARGRRKRLITNWDKQALRPGVGESDWPETLPVTLFEGSRTLTHEHLGLCPNEWPMTKCFDRKVLNTGTGILERAGNTDAANANWTTPAVQWLEKDAARNPNDLGTQKERWGDTPSGTVVYLNDALIASINPGCIRIHGMDVKWADLECIRYRTTAPVNETAIWTRTGSEAPDVAPLSVSGGVASGGNPRAVQRLDEIINRAHTMGMKVIYCLGDTVPWGSTGSALSPWSIPGGSFPPASMSDFANYVTWVCTRYRGKLWAIETWNEPGFHKNGDGSYGPITDADVNVSGAEWRGTPVQLAQLQKVAYQAVKAVDSGVKVLSPGFVGLDYGTGLTTPGFIADWFNTPVGDGTYARQWCDAMAFHIYDTSLDFISDARYIINTYAVLRAQMAFGGLASGFPVYITECGIHTDAEGLNVQFTSMISNAMRGRVVIRLTLLNACVLGALTSCWWHLTTMHSGAPGLFQPVAAEYASWARKFVGRTVTKIVMVGANRFSPHALQVTFADGYTETI